MSISSAIPINSIANYLTLGGNAASSAGASASSGATDSSSGSSAGAAPSGTAALYQQLSTDVQSYLMQLQGNPGSASAAPTASGSATPASAGGTDAASATDGSSGGNQAVGHHHHHHSAGGGEAGDGNLNADPVDPLTDVAGGTTSGTGTASSTGSSSGVFGGASTRYAAALQAYGNSAGLSSSLSSLA